MTIPVSCSCGGQYTAPDRAAGRSTKCPGCGEVVTVPPLPSHPDSALPTSTPAPKPKLQLVSILQRHASEDGIFVAPHIPRKKILKAVASCKIPRDERIFALIDCTVFGSAKNSLSFGKRGVYFHNDWAGKKPGPGFIAYQEFPSRQFTTDGSHEVGMGQGDSLECSGCTLSVEQVAELLREIQAEIVSKVSPDPQNSRSGEPSRAMKPDPPRPCAVCHVNMKQIYVKQEPTEQGLCMQCHPPNGCCPMCSAHLRTALASQCMTCGASWHHGFGDRPTTTGGKPQCGDCQTKLRPLVNADGQTIRTLCLNCTPALGRCFECQDALISPDAEECLVCGASWKKGAENRRTLAGKKIRKDESNGSGAGIAGEVIGEVVLRMLLG